MGLMQRVTAISARIGTSTLAVAVLEAMLVMVTVRRQTTKLSTTTGRLSSSARFRNSIISVERPELSEALARANPPPRRKMTPQHILVSMSRQVMREGEFWRLWLMRVKGQKSYCCGRMNSRIDMKMAGVAEPTDTCRPPCVSTVKKSAQPGMNLGDWKNQSRMRMMKRTKTWSSCRLMLPRAAYFYLITLMARSCCSRVFFSLPR